MRDFNFFEIYNETARKKKKNIAAFLVFFVFLSVAGFFVFTLNYVFELRMQQIQHQIDSTRLYLSNPHITNEIGRHAILSDQLDDLNSYNKAVDLLSEQIKLSSLIKTDLIQSIADNITADTEILSFSVSAGTINISGVSGSEISIAQFEHNMAGLSFVDSVFVSGISRHAALEAYSFTMSIRVKGVVTDVGND